MSYKRFNNGGFFGPRKALPNGAAATPGVWALDEFRNSSRDPPDPNFGSVNYLLLARQSSTTPLFYNRSPRGPNDGRGSNLIRNDFATFKWENQSYFLQGGATAGSFILHGAGTNVSSATEMTIGTGDFTWEGWAYTTSTGGDSVLIDQRPPTTNGLYPTIYKNSSGKVTFYTNSLDRINASVSVTTLTWFHWMVNRTGGTTYMGLNGANVGSFVDANNYLSNGAVYVGQSSFIASGWSGGYIDSVRFTKGLARYGSGSYTVPTAAFPDR